jgi:hypothetical protein
MQFNTPNVSEMEYGIEFVRLQGAVQTSQPTEVDESRSGYNVRDPRTPPSENFHPPEPTEEPPVAEAYQPKYGPSPSAQSLGAGDGGDTPTCGEPPVPALYDPIAAYAIQYTQQMWSNTNNEIEELFEAQRRYREDPDAIH